MSYGESCKTCKYWRELEPDGMERHACMRYPPVVIYKFGSNNGTARYPGTMPDDWCGEYVCKEPIS